MPVTICLSCHHPASCRFDGGGRQCYCRCHDVADAGPEILAACKALLDLYVETTGGRKLLDGFSEAAKIEASVRAVMAKAEVR